MATPPLPDDVLKEASRVFQECGKSLRRAGEKLGIPESTLKNRLKRHDDRFGKPTVNSIEDVTHELNGRIKLLETQLATAREDTLTDRYIRSKILHLSEQIVDPPKWLINVGKSSKAIGVPTLFLSDLHWGEIVDPTQIGGVNEYNLEIAQARVRQCVNKAVQLLKVHISTIDYPGIVLALGGDMLSGDIHEELMATNEKEIMPTLLDIYRVLIWVISTLADEFGKVFVPCVSGNHGRNTHKIRAKGRNFTSFDWLLYQFLESHFRDDKRVTFHIPNGSDAYYRVFEHKFLLTHGDQFRGGDGVIGALGPIIRGDHKKRSRNAQIEMEYDTMLLGHWHQLIQLRRLIVNGSTKGYDEYAWQNNFGFEPPQQALWINSPGHGITFSMPVHLGEMLHSPAEWVSWRDAK